MLRMTLSTVLAKSCLPFVLLLYVVVWVATPQEFSASDPLAYSQRAFAISQQWDFGSSDVFSHRLAVTVPVALLYSGFGVNIITTNLWPLCAVLLIIITVWLALPDLRSKSLGVALCFTSVPLLNASGFLFPDVIAASFMALSSLLLFNRRRFLGSRRGWYLAPVAAVAFLLVASLAKESAYWVLPLWVAALVNDLNDRDRVEVLRRFHLPAFGAAVVLGVAYLVFCQVTWGDPLARFRNLLALTDTHLWSRESAAVDKLVRRLGISAVRLFVGQYGVPVLLLACLGLVIAPGSIRRWGYYTVACLLFFWFGSTTFTRYEPLPLVERMTLPALPGFYVLAAFMASRLVVTSERAGWINVAIPVVLILGLSGVPFIEQVTSRRERGAPEAQAMAIVREAAASDPERQHLLVTSDARSPVALAFYFGHRYPANLRVVSVGTLSGEFLERAGKTFVFIERQRSAFLKSAYGQPHYDEEIEALGLASVYAAGNVVLLTSEREDQLKQLLGLKGRGTSDVE